LCVSLVEYARDDGFTDQPAPSLGVFVGFQRAELVLVEVFPLPCLALADASPPLRPISRAKAGSANGGG
jgi:hypothetical protein